MTADSQSRKVYFSKLRVGFLAFYVALVVLAAVLIVSNVDSTTTDVIAIVVALLLLAGFGRYMSCRVIADNDAVTVRNPLRSYRIAWSDIAEIHQYKRRYAQTTRTLVAFRLRNDQSVHAVSVIGYFSTSYPKSVIAELEGRAHTRSPQDDHATLEALKRFDDLPGRDG